MSETTAPSVTATVAPPVAKTRPFYWSVRRELWEHGSVYMAPLVAAALSLVGYVVGTYWLAGLVRAATAARRHVRTMDTSNVEAFAAATKAAVRSSAGVVMPYMFVAGVVFAVAIAVTLFYASGALYGERRDRTILFWKSLPVSDTTTLLAKTFIPLLVIPAVIFVVVFATHLVMLAVASVVLLANGVSPADLTGFLPIPFLWASLGRGVFIMAAWHAPIICWLILVSGWAKRVAFLWAVGPWLAICIVEKIALNSMHFPLFLLGRLVGGYQAAFTVDGRGGADVERLADLGLTQVLNNPGLWGGLVFAAACVAAAVRLRRYRDPI
jgi:ABC-2 type transport system permease protein